MLFKRVYDEENELVGIVGATEDIKRIYTSIYKAYLKGKLEWIYPSYFMEENGLPAKYKFSKNKAFYMLSIGERGIMTTHASDTVLGLVMEDGYTLA